MTGCWRVDTPGVDPENRRWFPTEAEADAKQDELKRGGARYVVVWEMGEPLGRPQEASGADLSALGVIPRVIGRLTGRTAVSDDETRSA